MANDIDENDFDYLIDRFVYFKNLFNSFLTKYNIHQELKDYLKKTAFIKTPEWLALKRYIPNPHNNDKKCFQYPIVLSLYHEQLGRNYSRISEIKQ